LILVAAVWLTGNPYWADCRFSFWECHNLVAAVLRHCRAPQQRRTHHLKFGTTLFRVFRAFRG
jgi:hypothetical protein